MDRFGKTIPQMREKRQWNGGDQKTWISGRQQRVVYLISVCNFANDSKVGTDKTRGMAFEGDALNFFVVRSATDPSPQPSA